MLGGADLRILQRGRKCYRPTQIRKPNQRDSQFMVPLSLIAAANCGCRRMAERRNGKARND